MVGAASVFQGDEGADDLVAVRALVGASCGPIAPESFGFLQRGLDADRLGQVLVRGKVSEGEFRSIAFADHAVADDCAILDAKASVAA